MICTPAQRFASLASEPIGAHAIVSVALPGRERLWGSFDVHHVARRAWTNADAAPT
jgi:GAF domain-containing protein